MNHPYIPEPLPEPAIKGVFEKEYKTIHKGDEYYSAEQVMKLCRMWAALYEGAIAKQPEYEALKKAAQSSFNTLENLAASYYALYGNPTPKTIADTIDELKLAGITHIPSKYAPVFTMEEWIKAGGTTD